MKVLVVMGTRPEAIKLAPVVAALRRRKGLKTFVCATAQHRDLLDQVLALFGLEPDFDLDVMRRGQAPDAVAKRVLAALDPLLARLKPDLIVVQGDTTSAAAAALCAFARGVAVAHVEAGLRSFDRNDPFPEERNRIVIDALSSLLFPPTPLARMNLKREYLGGRTVITTGNTVVDALRSAGSRARKKGPPGVREILVTLHRREIHGVRFRRICAALVRLAQRHDDIELVYPVHPNPAISRPARRLLTHSRIRLTEPLPYAECLGLLRRSLFVITDSGGLQEEAACLGKPLLIVREKTERPEIVAAGAGRLVGYDPKRLESCAEKFLRHPDLLLRMSRTRDIYGDGRASRRVAAGVAHWFGLAPRPADWKPRANPNAPHL